MKTGQNTLSRQSAKQTVSIGVGRRSAWRRGTTQLQKCPRNSRSTITPSRWGQRGEGTGPRLQERRYDVQQQQLRQERATPPIEDSVRSITVVEGECRLTSRGRSTGRAQSDPMNVGPVLSGQGRVPRYQDGPGDARAGNDDAGNRDSQGSSKHWSGPKICTPRLPGFSQGTRTPSRPSTSPNPKRSKHPRR